MVAIVDKSLKLLKYEGCEEQVKDNMVANNEVMGGILKRVSNVE